MGEIRVSSGYGLTVIDIWVKHSQDEKEEVEEELCTCFPCFSECQVLKVYLNGVDQESTDDETTRLALEAGYRYYYDISVCTGLSYVIFEGYQVKSAGFGKYLVDQECMLTIDVGISGTTLIPLPNCCINTSCLVSDLTNTTKLLPEFMMIIPIEATV